MSIDIVNRRDNVISSLYDKLKTTTDGLPSALGSQEIEKIKNNDVILLSSSTLIEDVDKLLNKNDDELPKILIAESEETKFNAPLQGNPKLKYQRLTAIELQDKGNDEAEKKYVSGKLISFSRKTQIVVICKEMYTLEVLQAEILAMLSENSSFTYYLELNDNGTVKHIEDYLTARLIGNHDNEWATQKLKGYLISALDFEIEHDYVNIDDSQGLQAIATYETTDEEKKN